MAGAAVMAGLSAVAADSPQWGEPFMRNRMSRETGLPAGFDPVSGSHVAWTAELGGPSTIHGRLVAVAGRLYVTVGGDRWWDKRKSWLVCVEMSGAADDGVAMRECWRRLLIRHSMSTPAVWQGMAFVPDSSSRLHCFDANNGEALWTVELRGEVSGSALAADGKVHVGTQLGVFYAFAAARTAAVLGEIAVGSPIWGMPAAANGRLFVASMKRLDALGARPR